MAGVMTPYIVRQGDYLAKLAFVKGFDADEVWNHPKNEDLKKLRQDPNILAPGDIVYVPAKMEEGALPIEKGTENNYAATVPAIEVQIVFKNADGPFASEPYEIQGLGTPVSGTTDADGGLVVDVPVLVCEFQILFAGRDILYPVRVGHMDPVTVASGARRRLRHLGYYYNPSREEAAGSAEDAMIARDRRAIQSFQRDKQLEPTGELDDATCAALVDSHGS